MSLSFLFYLTATIAVASAIFVVLNRNAVYSAILLVLCFFSLAVLYLLLEAYFLAVLEVFIYAGAIMVLFLFAIMLLNLGHEDALPKFMHLQRALSVLMVALFFFGIILIMLHEPGVCISRVIHFQLAVFMCSEKHFFPNICSPSKLLHFCCL